MPYKARPKAWLSAPSDLCLQRLAATSTDCVEERDPRQNATKRYYKTWGVDFLARLEEQSFETVPARQLWRSLDAFHHRRYEQIAILWFLIKDVSEAYSQVVDWEVIATGQSDSLEVVITVRTLDHVVDFSRYRLSWLRCRSSC